MLRARLPRQVWRPVKPPSLVPRRILPRFLVLAERALRCFRARTWVLTCSDARKAHEFAFNTAHCASIFCRRPGAACLRGRLHALHALVLHAGQSSPETLPHHVVILVRNRTCQWHRRRWRKRAVIPVRFGPVRSGPSTRSSWASSSQVLQPPAHPAHQTGARYQVPQFSVPGTAAVLGTGTRYSGGTGCSTRYRVPHPARQAGARCELLATTRNEQHWLSLFRAVGSKSVNNGHAPPSARPLTAMGQ